MSKILIVDDEAHIRRLLEETLEELEDNGVEIISAKNGKEAIEMITSHHPKIIYLDVMMPEMNGYDVCKIIKEDSRFQDVYVIMLTAKGQEFDKKKGLDVGADMYITKPFDPDMILDYAKKVLRS